MDRRTKIKNCLYMLFSCIKNIIENEDITVKNQIDGYDYIRNIMISTMRNENIEIVEMVEYCTKMFKTLFQPTMINFEEAEIREIMQASEKSSDDKLHAIFDGNSNELKKIDLKIKKSREHLRNIGLVVKITIDSLLISELGKKVDVYYNFESAMYCAEFCKKQIDHL